MGASIVVRVRHCKLRAGRLASDGRQHQPLELSREPLLACIAGTLLATGLLAAGHAAVVEELPLTAAVERNERPPSQRYRTFPRTSVVETVAGEESAEGETRSQRRPGDFTGDLALLHRLLAMAGLLFAVGIVGLLARRDVWACGISALAALLAVVLLVTALAILPFRAGRVQFALLPIAVLAAELGLLGLAALRWLNAEACSAMTESPAPGGPP
jgi:NADH:ubiquinone oxidoreductase subunit K